MARYSYSGNKKHKKKQNHASEYLPYIINDLSDEIEVVEQALSAGQEGQVLTADSAGKAQWADLLNDIQDEIEIVEQVLSGGEEGQVLTADSAGKAQWAEARGGGVIYDGIEETHEYDSEEGAYKINLTLTLNGESINDDSFVMYKTSRTQLDFSQSDFYMKDYTETSKFVYADIPVGTGIGNLYVKFYLPSGATMVFLIYDASGGI